MDIREIMTEGPACCTPETSLSDVAALMVECDCGEIPVVSDRRSMMLIGVVTDRDIVCRAVAAGQNPTQMTAQQVMTTPVHTVTGQASIEDCARVMEDHMIRRVPVVDVQGCLCGIVAQADIARYGPSKKAAEVVREVSQPSGAASRF